PDDFDVGLDLADCLMNMAALDEAEPVLRRLNANKPGQPAVLVGLASCAQGRGDLDEALGYLSDAAKKAATSEEILNALGNIHLVRREYDPAIILFERVLKLNADNRQAHLQLSQALPHRNKKEDLERIKFHERRANELRVKDEKSQRPDAK